MFIDACDEAAAITIHETLNDFGMDVVLRRGCSQWYLGDWVEITVPACRTLSTEETVKIPSGLTIDINGGTLSTWDGTIEIDQDGTLNIINGGTLSNYAGTIHNGGTINNKGGTIENKAVFNNYIESNDGAYGGIVNNDGVIKNAGSFDNIYGAELNNNGDIINSAPDGNSEINNGFDNNGFDGSGSRIYNHGTIFNNGLFENQSTGKIMNTGTIDNEPTHAEVGAESYNPNCCRGDFGNDGQLSNSGTIVW